MNILVINSGSSSIKYQLFKMPCTAPICSGLVERIGLQNSSVTHKVYSGDKERAVTLTLNIPDHETGMIEIGKVLTEPGIGVIKNPEEIEVVGHRVVHGGEKFSQPAIITAQVKEEIKKLFSLAPLHNPGHYKGIEIAEKLFPKASHIAVFDTAFHQTMPEKAFRYAIPNSYYTDYHIRAYGFHGTSHKYVTAKTLKYLDKPDAKIITIHLGNGCSMAAVDAGKCIDTSMGLTPLDGLIMGTRCGNIDASVILYLEQQEGYTAERVNAILNKESGMTGLTGHADMRDIQKLIADGDEAARLAYDMYAYRIKKFIGSYAAALNGLDAVVFTAGVGENDSLARELACRNLDFFGIVLDGQKNNLRSPLLREISTTESRVKVLVVPTNEELEIATQCVELLSHSNKQGK
ncbi:acetate/propionate family kinase [Mucilaginibacter xinganensis]|uniref:Acetate kinase n=1 Tax=Mucilaginibacter xinganensis TaxID=1234841 RepID=A0A223NPW9_9SPHI|nr:acetate kinase [Mucilaginibacter xinganensis]ASU31949.1 acetate kinase [Mucilaginibacter xinganensis]